MRFRYAVIAVLCMSPVYADILSVSPGANSVAMGGVFTLDVDVSSVIDLYAYQFDLQFDPAALQVLWVSEGDFLSGGGPTLFVPGTIDNVSGLVTFTADTLQGASGVSGSGTLAAFSFQAIALGSTPVSIENAILLDSTLSGISFSVSDGAAAVGVPEPSSFALTALFAAVVLLRGQRRRLKRRQ